MRIRGVLLGTLEEQRAGARTSHGPLSREVDPRLVPAAEGVPVEINFDPTLRVGVASVGHDGVGRLVFEADLFYDPSGADPLPPLAAYGGLSDRVISIGLCDQNENRDQPPWEIVPLQDYIAINWPRSP